MNETQDNEVVGSPAPTRRIGLWLPVAIAIAAGLLMRWHYTHEAAVDQDELQHLHFAWCITQDMVPYRDFWDNHPPGLHHALAEIIDLTGTPTAAFQTARLWMYPIGLIALAATYLLARTAFGARCAALSVGWLACCEAFILKTVEIRPDGIWAVSLILALWMLTLSLGSIRWLRASLYCLAAGALLGGGMILTTKTLMPLAVVVPAWALANWLSQERPRVRFTLLGIGALALGLALPVASWLVYESSQGAARAALQYTVIDNFTDPDRFNVTHALTAAWPYAFFAVALIGAALVLRQARLDIRAHSRPLLVALTALGTACLYAFVMPSPFLQSSLMFVPLFAILAGHVTCRVVKACGAARKRGDGAVIAWASLSALIFVGCVWPILRLHLQRPHQRSALAATLARMDWIHGWTNDNDAVFDGQCMATFRRHAVSRPSLVHGALRGYIEGTSAQSISDELRARHCTVVLHDARTAEIPPRDRAFIDTHFVQIKDIDASVYLPGQRYEAADLRDAGIEFNVVTPGRYRIRRGLTDSVTRVDQRAVEASVELDVGPHVIESLGPPSALTIWRVPGQ